MLRSQAHRIANTMARVQPFDTLFGRINAKDDTGQKSLVEVGDGSLIGTAQPVYLDHVAIDRITGFAADSKKFSTCALQSPRFQVRLRVRFTQRDLASLALFAFVFRDLCDGWLWVGGGVTRGFGHLKQVKATSMTLNCTSDFAVPPGFHSTAQTPARGRTRLTVDGPLDFYSLNWLWEQAEQAWKANPSQEGAA